MTRGDYSLTQRAQRGEAATKKGWPSLNAECAEGLERVAEGWIFGGVKNLRKARTFFGFALRRRQRGRRGGAATKLRQISGPRSEVALRNALAGEAELRAAFAPCEAATASKRCRRPDPQTP